MSRRQATSWPQRSGKLWLARRLSPVGSDTVFKLVYRASGAGSSLSQTRGFGIRGWVPGGAEWSLATVCWMGLGGRGVYFR
jgi:hypothetical protein